MKTLRFAALAALLAFVLAPAQARADTPRFYPYVAQARADVSSLQVSSIELVRFMIEGTTAGGGAATGPGWTGVEFYSDGGREVPPTPTDLDSLTSAVAWKGDGSGLSVGDWAVIESADSTGGGGTNHFQVLIEYDSTITWKFVMMPLEDWQVGTAVPDTPGTETRVGAGGGMIAFTTHYWADTLDIIADEDVVIIRRDDASTVDQIYIGAVDGNMTTSTPADDRPFVIYDMPARVWFSQSGMDYWNRLAPDDATTLTLGSTAAYQYDGCYSYNLPSTYNGAYQLLPVMLMFADAGHGHVTGFLQYVRTTSDSIGSAATTLGGKEWACRNNNATLAPMCLKWDGTTVYP